MMPRFPPMVRKEFIQMRRDRLTLAIMVGLPVAQLLLFGFAIQTDVRHLPTVVLDQSRTPPSRDLIAAFENTGNFRIIGYVDDRPALDRAIGRGDAKAIVRERERGTLEQLIVTPVTKTELMLGKITPYVGVGLVQMTAVLVLGRVVFEVPLSGNVLLLYAIALLFVIASLSFGVFISSLVRTQQQAMQVASCFRASCSRARRCHRCSSGWACCCRSRTFSKCCGGFCSRAWGWRRSGGRWPC